MTKRLFVVSISRLGLALSAGFIVLTAALSLLLTRTTGKDLPDVNLVNETVLTIAIGAEPLRLDPHDARDAPSSLVNYHIYDRLVDVGVDGAIVPGLAQSWQVSPDGKEYTMTLQKGVRFHDGLPLTAEAVVVNFERLMASESGLARAELVRPYIESITALDDETLLIRLHRPLGPFLRYLAHESLGIISPRSIEMVAQGGAFRPIGTGPFYLKDWTPGEQVALAAFTDHWRGTPSVDGLIFKPIPDGSSRLIALETGAVDVAYPIDPVHIRRLNERAGIQVAAVPSQRVIYAAFNLPRAPLDSQRFRQALNYAVDVEAITRHLLFDLAHPLASPLSRATWGSASVSPYRYDPETAKELMTDGSRIERPLELWSPSSRYVQDREVAQAIAGYLRDIGLDVRIRLFEWGTYLALLSTSDQWDIAILGWVPASGEADMGLRPLYHSASRGNHSRYYSADVDTWLDEAVYSIDETRRSELYRKVQEAIVDDAPSLFLYSIDLVVAHRSEVAGVVVHSTEIVDLRGAYRRESTDATTERHSADGQREQFP